MRQIKKGDKVLAHTHPDRDSGYYITPLMEKYDGKVLVVARVVTRGDGVTLYQFTETGISHYWTDKWITPLSELSLYDLLKLNITQ